MKPIPVEPLIPLTKESLNHMTSHFMQEIKPHFSKQLKHGESFHLKIKPMLEDDCCVIHSDLCLEDKKLFAGFIGAFTIPKDMDFIEDNIDIETIWKVNSNIIISVYPIGIQTKGEGKMNANLHKESTINTEILWSLILEYVHTDNETSHSNITDIASMLGVGREFIDGIREYRKADMIASNSMLLDYLEENPAADIEDYSGLDAWAKSKGWLFDHFNENYYLMTAE